MESDFETHFHINSDVELFSNSGMSFESDKERHFHGIDRDRCDTGQRGKSIEYSFCQMERKDLRIRSRGKSGLGFRCSSLSKGDREGLSSKGITETVWKWITSIGVSVFSFWKWIS